MKDNMGFEQGIMRRECVNLTQIQEEYEKITKEPDAYVVASSVFPRIKNDGNQITKEGDCLYDCLIFYKYKPSEQTTAEEKKDLKMEL